MTGRRAFSTTRILDAAFAFMVAGSISLIAMQAIRGDWFPPAVSISQYGVGEYAWTLTVSLLLVAVASALLLLGARRQGAAPNWPVILAWTVWTVALVVMALVPTNVWPSPLTLRGQVHQAAAVLGLFAGPIGAVLMVGLGARAAGLAGSRGRTVAIACAALSWFFLGLLVLTNIDIDITGLGNQGAWSLHQTVAVLFDIVMIFAATSCLRARAVAAGGRPFSSPPSASASASRSVLG